MDVETLRVVATGISGRKLDPVLEAYLPQFAAEIEPVLRKMREVARKFPLDLEPAPVFSLRRDNAEGRPSGSRMPKPEDLPRQD
jgi:hypothetical protein